MVPNVGQFALDFTLESHLGDKVRLSQYRGDKHVVIAFFPLAWTPVWTSQIPSYQAALDRFERVQTQVLGLSVDSVPCLKAWAESMEGITYPLLSDFYPHGAVAAKYGVLREDGTAERAIFVVDKRGVIRYVDVHDIDEQPDNEELFRVLDQVEPNPIEPALSSDTQESEIDVEPDADVVLYCTPWCPACRKARAYLNEHQIEFVEIDITRDRTAAQRIRNWTGGYETTPTLKINGEIIINFDREKVAASLDLN